MPGPALYELQTTLWSRNGEEAGGLLRLVWSETTDADTWMGRRLSGETFASDSQTDVYRWLVPTEPEQPEPVATPQPTAPRRRK